MLLLRRVLVCILLQAVGAAAATPVDTAGRMGPEQASLPTSSAPPTETVAAHERDVTDVRPPLEAWEIGGVSIDVGERKEIFLRSSESFSAADVKIPLVVIRGTEPGPTLCLLGGIHGDELNGIEIVRESVERAPPPDALHGALIGVPIVNLFGFWNQSRYLPDRRDLNRHFPGSPTGSSASRIANHIWKEVVRRCTHMVDFHTGSLHRSNLPQVRGDLRRPEVLRFAHAFGGPTIVHNPGQRGTLRAQAVDAGIPTVLYEAGETMRFQRNVIEQGVTGVENVMAHLGMVPDEPERPSDPNVFLETHWVRSQQGGILELYPQLGDWVRHGDVIGVVTDPLRNTKGVIRSPWTGQVIGKVLSPMVIPGLAVVHVGLLHGRMERTEAVQEEVDAERPE